MSSGSPTTHVDQIDLADLDNYADGPPWELYTVLRREAPVHWNPLPDEPGFWSITRYDDIAQVHQDSTTYSSGRAGVFIRDEQLVPWEVAKMVLLNQDPPRHTQTRAILQKVFTATALAEQEANIRAVVAELLDAIVERGEADLVSAVAIDLPLRVIADMLGIPRADQRPILAVVLRLGEAAGMDERSLETGRKISMEAFGELGGYLYGLLEERRANPTGDLISRLIAAEVEGERLDEVSLLGSIAFLLSAGSEETRNAYSGGILALIEHPDERRKLLEDPSLVPVAIEEILRWHTPILHMRRTATRDSEIRGVAISEGEKVVVWYPSGNRDERAFDDPERFDVTRTSVRHQAFGGGGRHFCLGNQLARLELRVLFEETLRRIGDIELAGPVGRQRSNFFHGITSLPVNFTPTRPEGRA